jgi:hypothetical protein
VRRREAIGQLIRKEERMRKFAPVLLALTVMCGAALATPPDSISLKFDPVRSE